MANLLLCVSQKFNNELVPAPYVFKNTKIRVFSFEEALYHVYHYWKQSGEEFTAEAFLFWVQNELELPIIATKIREIGHVQKFSERLVGFLSLCDYIGEERISLLREEFLAWEKRVEWEKLKEQADFLVNSADPETAAALYKKALKLEENTALLNNMGIAYNMMGSYAEAAKCFIKAIKREPETTAFRLNLIESLILNGDYENAGERLAEVDKRSPDNPDAVCFWGDIAYRNGNFLRAIQLYEQALGIKYDVEYVYRISDVHVKMRQNDKALDALDAAKDRDKRFLKKQAEIYAGGNNIPAAIKVIEEAIYSEKDNIDLWVLLAFYHRLDYDLTKAHDAIVKVLSLDPKNPLALLESARIRKAQGRIKDYQSVLNMVLQGFKEKYRENLEFY